MAITGGKAERSMISVVLLPNQADTQALAACSAAIGHNTPSAIALGSGCLPHIIIVQFFAEADEAQQLWNEVQGYKDFVDELASVGVSFVPGRTRDETWAALTFMKSDAVAALQAAVLATGFAAAHQTNNGTGDSYWPHVTLALLSGRRTTALELGPHPICRRAFTNLTLAVGINGPNMTVARVLPT